MPIHSCEICNFQTEKKSTYNDHLKSKKHVNKLNGDCCSSTTSSSINDSVDNTSTASRIRELENQLKLKEMQIEKMMIELKHKDEIISILRQQPAPQNNIQLPQNNIQLPQNNIQLPQNNTQLVIQEIPQAQTKKLSVMEYLNTKRTNAPTIEQCYKMMNNSKYNNYLQYIENKLDGKDYNILAPSKSRNSDYKQRGVDNAIEIISKFFNEIPANSRPFYCSDKRRNILYIKTNNGWIKQNDENKQEFDEILLILVKEALGSVRKAVGSISILFRNRSDSLFRNIYDINYGDWSSNNLSEILNVLFLMGDGKHGLIKSDEELDNERLVVKLLKVQLAKMCHSINNDCETDEE
jgi:hypothetical protein